jgi:prephenate dehydrogenase
MIKLSTKFLIIGLGLIGGSYAMGLKKAGYQVSAIDKDKKAIKYALENILLISGRSLMKPLLNKRI